MKKSKLLTLLVLVLAVCTIFGMMALSASAAEADHPHTDATTHCACGGLGAKEDHSACTDETWKAWTNGMTSPTSGNYYLAEDVTVTKAISLGGNLKICLNGYTLTCDGARLTTYTGTSLKNIDVCDCSQGKTGKITSNFAANQGGIFLHRCGSINLYSGTLEHTATESTVNGGIIRLGFTNSTSTAAFNMYGGTLTGGVAAKGGNIYAGESTKITVNLYGGTITGGTATTYGGNICMDKGVLNLKGTTICNGTCTDGVGGNVYTVVTTNMTKGQIYGGTASGYGDNMQLQGSAFTMTGGSIGEENQTATEAGHNLNMINATFSMTGGKINGLVRATCAGDKTGTITINQNAQIAGAAENLRLVHNNVTLNVGSALHDLGDSGLVGITLDSAYTNATFATATADPAGKVFSDKAYTTVVYADGQLALAANTMQVGYNKVSIAPATGTPLGGYGASASRLSTGNDELYGLTATVIAITDADGETVLLITADLVSLTESVVAEARAAITEATGVPADHIMISATHTHTAPDLALSGNDAIEAYKTLLYSNLAQAAQAAIADQAAATASIGTVEISGQNYVRHYTDGEGNYYGYAHWAGAALDEGKTLTHAAEADCTMQLLKFDRGDKTPVVLANWQTHPHLLGNVDYASADLIGAFRDALATAQGWNVAYFTGASGNINPNSLTVNDEKTYVSMGQAMAEVAATVQFTEAGLEAIDTKQTKYAATYKEITQEQYDAAVAFLASEDTGWAAAKAAGFNSIYHAKTIKAVYEAAQKSATKSLELNVISLGQIAFVTAPYEMFDTNGETIKSSSAYEMTFVLTQANGSVGYIPADLSNVTAPDGIYELDSTKFVAGTGEELANVYVAMLSKLSSGNYCVCGDKCFGRQGHICEDVSWTAFPGNSKMPTSGNYYLNEDTTITFTAGLCSIDGALALDLHGQTLTLEATGKGRAFTVGAGETFSICDSVGGGQIILQGNLEQIGGLIFNAGGTANIYGGTIDASAINTTVDGVVIRSANNSTCNIYNATLIGGSTSGNGGVISNSGTLNVYTDVTLKNGSAAQGGNIYSTTAAIRVWGNVTGGVATEKGGNIYTAYTAYVYGKIDNGSAPLGGNIFQSQYTLFLFGAQIRDAKQGGGVYINTGAKVTVGADTVTSMNKMDDSGFVNLYLPTGTLIGLGTGNEPLVAAASVGITQEDPAQPIADTANSYLAQGVKYADVFYKQNAECGVAEIDGKLYFRDYVAYAYYKQDNAFKSQGYYSIEDALAHTDVIYVQLCADRNEALNITSDTYLDLAGYSINATVSVADGATLYGLDSATNDFDISDGYGKIATINGAYAMVHAEKLTTQTNRYVTVIEETGISFHRYYAALTAINLKPSADALGFKATFRGDEMVLGLVSGYGFNMWVKGSSVKTCLKDGSFTDGQVVTLRMQNILAGDGGEVDIYGQAVVKFSHIPDLVNGSTGSTNMKATLQLINDSWATYTDIQRNAVKRLCEKFEVTMNWNLNNIFAES